MLIEFEVYQQRLRILQNRISDLCAQARRSPTEVKLLPVTKNHPPAAAEYVHRSGLHSVGENRVQEAADKRAQLTCPLHWELIGHLQSNKAKTAVRCFERIQSVDSEKLLTVLDRAAGELGKKLPVLLQINAGNDPAKFGADPADACRLLETALAKPNLQVDGLMTIAPLAEDPDVAVRTFANLRTIRDTLRAQLGAPLTELSMGMSGDLAAAIAEGSTMIRIGTALFGPRTQSAPTQ